MFDALIDAMRTHSTEWLETRRCEVISAQRELHAEELAIVRVLDERGRIDPSMGAQGESARVVRDKVETARSHSSRRPPSPMWRWPAACPTSSSPRW